MNFLDASQLDNYYFATKTMVAGKVPPCNLHKASLGNYPYPYSKEHITMKGVYQDNRDEQRIILNVTIDNIKMVLKKNEQNNEAMIRLIDATQTVRTLFSQKRQD